MTRKSVLLDGGYLNKPGIAKVGRTVVRKQDHPWPFAVSEALAVLHRRGFRHCPTELRRVDSCSVILTYMPGRSIPDLPPAWAASAHTLARITRFVGEFSAAAGGMRDELAHFDWLISEMSDGEVFVHGDPHPTNLVFDIWRRPSAIIDFELATLGTHEWNLVSLIFCWAPLEPVHLTCWRQMPMQPVSERIKLILENWQFQTTKDDLVETARTFIDWRRAWIAELARHGNPGAVAFIEDRTFERRYQHALEVLYDHADLCQLAIDRSPS